VAVYASMSGITTLAGLPSIQLSDGCNLFSLLLFIGLESVRDESWSVASGSLTNRCTSRNSFEDSKIVFVSYIVWGVYMSKNVVLPGFNSFYRRATGSAPEV